MAPLALARGTEKGAKIVQVERIRVLLVEDDLVQANAIRATLVRTPELDFQVATADRLSTAVAHLAAGEYDAVLIRDSAISSDQGRAYVLTVDDKNTVVYRAVSTGPLVDGMRVIRDGLKETDRVIVAGLMSTRLGLTVQPQLVDMSTNAVTTASTNSAR